MSSALEAFRAQRDIVDDVQARLTEVAGLLRAIKDQADSLAHNGAFLNLLHEEQTWLLRAEQAIASVRHAREWETHRFWPAVWRRWAVATVFALVSVAAAGAGYVWASRPYQAELAALRARVEFGDTIARRVLAMTPTERRQFDALMKRNTSPK